MSSFKTVAWWLMVVGGLNWGLVGLGMLLGGSDWNLVHLVFGGVPVLEALVYLVVGLSTVWVLVDRRGSRK